MAQHTTSDALGPDWQVTQAEIHRVLFKESMNLARIVKFEIDFFLTLALYTDKRRQSGRAPKQTIALRFQEGNLPSAL